MIPGSFGPVAPAPTGPWSLYWMNQPLKHPVAPLPPMNGWPGAELHAVGLLPLVYTRSSMKLATFRMWY